MKLYLKSVHLNSNGVDVLGELNYYLSTVPCGVAVDSGYIYFRAGCLVQSKPTYFNSPDAAVTAGGGAGFEVIA